MIKGGSMALRCYTSLSIVLISLFLIQCGSEKFEGNSFALGDSSYSGTELEGGAVSAIEMDGTSATLEFGSVPDSSKYMISIYSYHSGGNTEVYQVGHFSETPKQLRTLEMDLTEDFHERLRKEESELDRAGRMKPSSMKMLTDGPAVGSSRSFKVLDSFSTTSSYATIEANLVYKTDHFLAYVDARNQSAMTQAEWETLLAGYDAMIDKEQGLFGRESDIDGDRRFNVLFTQTVNELGGSAGGIVTGFFYAVDLFSTSYYSQSNETEIFYTFVPDPTGNFGTPISKEFAISNILPSVLPHEYQHMINFNQHYFVNQGSPEESFLNEALAHLAEDIYSMDGNGYMTKTGIENPARVSGYLAAIDDLCIVCGASLYQRGGSYLLLRYLYEQAEKGNLSAVTSGKDLLNALLNTKNTGVINIVTAAYGTTDVTLQFRDLMGQFGLAVFMSNTELTTDSRLGFEGINLRASQNDNRGTFLQGPAINNLSSNAIQNTVGGASISFVEITGEEINSMNGTVNLALSGDAQVGIYLIQTGL